MPSFSHPLLRNYRFFGLFPILFTQLPAMPLDTAGEKDKYDPSHSINNAIKGYSTSSPVFCSAKYRGGVRRTEGLKNTIKIILGNLFNLSPQELLFLRSLPYC